MTREKTAGQKAKDKTKAKFYNPPNILREKVGLGGIDPAQLKKAEIFIDDNKLDFTPYAEELLVKLRKAIKAAKAAEKADKAVVNTIVASIMEMKANGGMFNYMLVTEIADVILGFLENLDELNQDAFDIVDVHQKTLEAIIGNKLTGNGGQEGKALAQELYDACRRYKRKYSVVVDV